MQKHQILFVRALPSTGSTRSVQIVPSQCRQRCNKIDHRKRIIDLQSGLNDECSRKQMLLWMRTSNRVFDQCLAKLYVINRVKLYWSFAYSSCRVRTIVFTSSIPSNDAQRCHIPDGTVDFDRTYHGLARLVQKCCLNRTSQVEQHRARRLSITKGHM